MTSVHSDRWQLISSVDVSISIDVIVHEGELRIFCDGDFFWSFASAEEESIIFTMTGDRFASQIDAVKNAEIMGFIGGTAS